MKSRTLTIKDHMTEFIVGFFFFLAIGVLVYYTILINKDSFSNHSYRVKIKFPEVSNLEEGNKVLLRGMQVGAVKKLTMAADGVMVEVAISEGVPVFKNCTVKVQPSSMLGGNLVNIEQGTPESGTVTTEDILTGEPYANIMAEAGEVLEELKASGAFDNLSETIKNFKKISAQISGGKGTLGKLINDDDFYEEAKTLIADLKGAGKSVSKASDNISSLVDEAKKMIKDLRSDIENTVGNMKKFTEQLNNKESSVAKLFSDKGTLFSKLDKSLTQLKDVSEKLNNGEGTLAKLLNDPAVFDDAKKTFADIRDAFVEVKGAVQDMRESSNLSTFGGFIFGSL